MKKFIILLNLTLCALGVEQNCSDHLVQANSLIKKYSNPKTSFSLQAMGFTQLTHKTQIEKLISILTTKGLVTGEKVPYKPSGVGLGANREKQIFASLANKQHKLINNIERLSMSSTRDKGISKGDLEAIIINIDLQRMDYRDYHVSSWLYYGEIKPNPLETYVADQHEELINKTSNALFQGLTKSSINEVVFYDDIPLKFFKSIEIHEEKYNDLINKLKSNGINTINNVKIEDFINPLS